MCNFRLNKTQVTRVEDLFAVSNLVNAMTLKYKKQLKEIVIMRNRRCITIVFKNMNAFPAVRRKIPVFQIFWGYRVLPFRNQQVFFFKEIENILEILKALGHLRSIVFFKM